jgi:hypothetical protein
MPDGPGEAPALMEAVVILGIPAVLAWFGFIELMLKLCKELCG